MTEIKGLHLARADYFRLRRRYNNPFRFVERYTSVDGIDFYAWERPLEGDSRVDRVTVPVDWFWKAGS